MSLIHSPLLFVSSVTFGVGYSFQMESWALAWMSEVYPSAAIGSPRVNVCFLKEGFLRIVKWDCASPWGGPEALLGWGLKFSSPFQAEAVLQRLRRPLRPILPPQHRRKLLPRAKCGCLQDI